MTAAAQKILIVDDNQKAVKTMYRQLKNYGYEDVHWAPTGAEGLKRIKTEIIHLAIIVTELPDADGFDLCRDVKQTHAAGIKVILMTGLAEMINVTKALDSGADGYVVRTSDYTFLMDAVTRIFSGPQSSEESGADKELP